MSALVSSHSAIADAECMNVTAELLLHNVWMKGENVHYT
jgi:hypothetical protein